MRSPAEMTAPGLARSNSRSKWKRNGMTPTGGANGLGTIYKIHPHRGTWEFQVIHTFTGGADGGSGSAGRMILGHGRLFGAATTGGTYGSGVVFELTPTPVGEWDLRTLYSFHGQPDGSFPYGALLRDGSGEFYGYLFWQILRNHLLRRDECVGGLRTLSRDVLVNGTRECFTAFKTEATAIVRLAILF
jgi:hypothetical protein